MGAWGMGHGRRTWGHGDMGTWVQAVYVYTAGLPTPAHKDKLYFTITYSTLRAKHKDAACRILESRDPGSRAGSRNLRPATRALRATIRLSGWAAGRDTCAPQRGDLSDSVTHSIRATNRSSMRRNDCERCSMLNAHPSTAQHPPSPITNHPSHTLSL